MKRLLPLLLLTGCAQVALFGPNGLPIARFQGNAAEVRYTGNGVTLTVMQLDNATATSAIWHGATRFTGALALAAAPFAPSITPVVAALPTVASGAGLFVTPPRPAANAAH